MSVHTDEQRRVPARDRVEVLAGGQGLRGPQRVVPAAAKDPLAPLTRFGGGDVGADTGLHLREGTRADEIHRQPLLAGAGHVGVRVVEAGHGEGALEVDDVRLLSFESQHRRVCAYRDDTAACDGQRGDTAGDGIGVTHAQAGAGEDVAVEEDRVGCGAGRSLLSQSRPPTPREGAKPYDEKPYDYRSRASQKTGLVSKHASSLVDYPALRTMDGGSSGLVIHK